MLNRSTIIYFVLSLLLVAYLCVALPMTARMGRTDTFRGLNVQVVDSAHTGFVTAADIAREAGLAGTIDTVLRGNFDLQAFENRLRSLDVVETVNVYELNNHTLQVEVVPMVPVARVFAPDGSSYYINAQGKRITANYHHHIDVPIVGGHFSAERPPERLLPMLSRIAADRTLNALVSIVEQNRRGEIFLVPTIRGHVVNIGDSTNMADKFKRLSLFYRKVMPVKGWNYYDTISLKFDGRIVASRRVKAFENLNLPYTDDTFDENDDQTDILELDELQAGQIISDN